jgi:hypothetical protein
MVIEGHLIGGVQVIARTGGLGQRQTPCDVIVVDVRLEHVGQPHTAVFQRRQDPVDITLRIHHERDRTVMHQITAITQRRGIDSHDLHHVVLAAHDRPTGGDPGAGAATDRDRIAPGRGQRSRGGAAAVTARTDHIDTIIAGQFIDASGQAAQRHQLGAGHVTVGVLRGLAHINHQRPASLRRGELLHIHFPDHSFLPYGWGI